MWTRLWAGPIDWQPILIALLPTLLVAWLVASLARRFTRAALKSLVGDTLPSSSPLIRAPLRLVFAATFILVSAVVIFPALEVAGLRPSAGRNLRELSSWLVGPGLRVVLIALVGYALHRATNLLVTRFEQEINEGATLDGLERAKRARTLGSAVNKVATALIFGIAAVMILNEVGVNIGPLLTGAGIVGLAVGFGAQTLVRDVLSGFFLLLEDQVRVGDSAAINGTGGVVEQLNLRTIVLRDGQGTVHVFPNGAINTLANQSKDFSRYVIDLSIAYEEDPDRVAEAAREVDRELRTDPRFEPYILEPVQILGVTAFSEWSMQLRMQIKTVPEKQWLVGREFRKRLRSALNRHGVEVPYPAFRPPSPT
jgi:small conductance mechanosensitive channel